MSFAPHGKISSFGKDRVEVSTDDNQRRRRASFEESETVSLFVNRDFAQTELAKPFREIFRALLFGEWRRGNRADANVFVSDCAGVGFEVMQRVFDLWRCGEQSNGLGWSSFE